MKAEKKVRRQNNHGYEGELVAIARIARVLKQFDVATRLRMVEYLKNTIEQEGAKTRKPVPPADVLQI